MTNYKRILADKLADEETGFKYSDISITKAKMQVRTEWDVEADDWKVEKVDALKVVIKEYEHIQFFITEEVDDYFGNQVWVWSQTIYPEDGTFDNHIIADTYSKTKDFGELTAEALVQLGYYIGSRF